MSKPKITEAKCFEEVAKVIGPKNAERELFIASQCSNCEFDPEAYDIWYAFAWNETKQDDEFWRSIAQGINPYNK